MKISAAVFTVPAAFALLALFASPVLAAENRLRLEIEKIEQIESSLRVSWSKVEGAKEYVVFDEVTKERNRGRQDHYIYRGIDPSFTLMDMSPGELARLRIVALDKNERVLARSMVRSNSSSASPSNRELTWISDNYSIEFRVEANSGDERLESVKNGKQELLKEPSRGAQKVGSGAGEYKLVSTNSQSGKVEKRGGERSRVPMNWTVPIPDLGKVDPSVDDLESEISEVREATQYEITTQQIGWRAFIADKYIPTPVTCGVDSGGVPDTYFGGDDRDFEWSYASPSRMTIDFGFNYLMPEWDSNWELAGFGEPYLSERPVIGVTKLYSKSGGTYEEIEADRAPSSDIEFSGNNSIEETFGEANAVGGSSNPLCSVFGIFDAPEINVDITAEVWKDGAYLISSYHDSAPSHEVYLHTVKRPVDLGTTEAEYRFNAQESTKCIYNMENKGFMFLASPIMTEQFVFDSEIPTAPCPG